MFYKRFPVSSDIKITKIAHAADIHIRNVFRHKEYQEVFQNWYEDLNSIKNLDLIVLAGDIIHSKTTISPEVVEMTYNLLEKLSSISDVIVIPGNHDVNLGNRNRKWLLSSIKKIHKLGAVHLLKQSGIYSYGNVDFYNFSILDNDHPKEIKDVNQKNIALYHGMLNGAVNKYGYEFESDVTYKNFKDFDITMLGDIHNRQYIGKSTIRYPGSLICQNYGEEARKGYLLWDLSDNTSSFREVKNDYAYYTIKCTNGRIEKYEVIESKHPNLRIFFDKASLKVKSQLIEEITENLEPSEISIHEQPNENDKNLLTSKDEFLNFFDVKVQNNLLRDYFKDDNSLKPKDISQILKINEDIEESLRKEGKYKTPNYGTQWHLERLEFSNMYRYKIRNVVNFKNLKGLVGIFGPNNIGKSTILEILYYALFGKTQKKIKTEKIVNKYKSTASTKVFLTINNIKYVIERMIQVSKESGEYRSSSVRIYKIIGEDSKKLLNGPNKNETERVIRNLIGSPEDFLNTTMISQNKETEFIESKATRKKIINRLIGLESFAKKHKIAKKSLRKCQTLIEDIKDENYSDKYDLAINNITGYKNKIKRKQKEIDKLSSKVEECEDYIDNFQNLIVNLDITELDTPEVLNSKIENKEKNIEEHTSKLSEYNNKIDEINKDISKVDDQLQLIKDNKYLKSTDLVEKTEEAKSDWIECKNKLEMIKSEMKSKAKQVQILKDEPWHNTEELCQECSLLQDAFQSKKDLSKLTKEYKNLEQECLSLQEKYCTWDTKLTTQKEYTYLTEQKKGLKVDKSLIERDIESVKKDIEISQSKIENYNKQIEEYNRYKEQVKKNEKIQTKIDTFKNQKKRDLNKLDEYRNELSDFKVQLNINKTKKEDIQEKMDKLEKLEETYKYYQYYIDAVNRDSIPYQIISELMPKINNEMYNLLEGVVPFVIKLENDDNDDIAIKLIKDSGEEMEIESEGGMANIVAGIVIRIALIQISSLPKSGLFAMDESFSDMDSDILASIPTLMDEIKLKFNNVMTITHIDSLKDMVDTIVDIEDDGKFSHIQC